MESGREKVLETSGSDWEFITVLYMEKTVQMFTKVDGKYQK